MNKCVCGCGNSTKWNVKFKRYNDYIFNHHVIGKKHSEETKEKLRKVNIGKKHSEETKRKIGLASKGRVFSEETRKKLSDNVKGKKNPMYGKVNPFKGKNHTKKTRKKMSLAKKGLFFKEDNPNWKGGKSFEKYSDKFTLELKRKIRKRDNNECQICFMRKYGRELDVHHIDYDKKNNKETNLISLCKPCHMSLQVENAMVIHGLHSRLIFNGYANNFV